MSLIRVRVGAQLDPSAVNIFKPLIAAAAQARAKIASEGKAGASEFVGGYRTAPAAARKGFDEVAVAAEKSAARVVASAKRAAREQQAAYEATWNYKKRLIEEESAAAEKALTKRNATIRSIGGGAASTIGGMLSRGAGVVGSIARGAGVNMDAGSLVGKVSGQQSTAVDISNSAYMEGGKGAAGQRQDPAKIIAEARDVADSVAGDTQDALNGLQKFVAKTSDLATGRAILGDMAKLAKVTGSSLEDMVDAAGDVSKQLGDIPGNAEKTKAIMTVIAAQGKLGSVEIKDLATQMAKVASASGFVSGGQDQAIIQMGMLAQTARGTGGAASANQAATSVASFASDIMSKPGQKALAGKVDIWADSKHTMMKPMQDIMKGMLEYTGGSMDKIAALLPGKQSGRAFRGVAKIYNDAEREKKGSGTAAVDAEFKRLSQTLSKDEIAASLKVVTNTTASKVQLFNNQMERVAESASAKVLPAMESLGPGVIRLAGYFGSAIGYIAENPVKGAFAGVGLAIGKEIASAGIKQAINSALAGSLGGLVIGSAVIAITAATIAMREKSEATTTDTIEAGKKAAAALSEGVDKGEVTSDQKFAAERALAITQSKIDNAGGPISAGMGDVFDKATAPLGPLADLLRPILAVEASAGSGLANLATGGKYGTSFQDQSQQGVDANRIDELKAEMTAVRDALNKLASSNLKVTVTNQPGAPVGPASPGTTTGPAAPR